jgi:hypothetical protein
VRAAYVVGLFRHGCLVDVGIYSEPFPTVAYPDGPRPYVLARTQAASYDQARRVLLPLLNALRIMVERAPASSN